MTLDKEEHRAILLQMIDQTPVPGKFARKVVELITALEAATIKETTIDDMGGKEQV